MKKILIIILLLLLLGGGAFIFLNKNGHNSKSMFNAPAMMNLKVDCSDVRNIMVSSTLNLSVSNNSRNQYNNVTVRITAYDKTGNILKQKETTFSRVLGANQSFNKIISLPRKVEKCDCVITRSDSN